MSNFHIGQKVVFVNQGGPWKDLVGEEHQERNYPVEGVVYTIRDFGPFMFEGILGDGTPFKCGSLLLVEVHNEPTFFANIGWIEPDFLAIDFRPVLERKTDISVFHEILRKCSNPLHKQPALISH